jgi:Zn-dependent protease
VSDLILQLALAAIPAILAITLHEAAHGYAALALGDDTARNAGRLSLNPLRHVDRVGTILLPGFLLVSQLLLAGRIYFMFGWAKPVPVNFGNLNHPKRDMLWVAAAGPAANFAMAFFWMLIYRLSSPDGALASDGMLLMSRAGVLVNVVLMVLNLLPIPPLDGGRIAISLLPHSLAAGYARLEPYGFMIILLLLASNVLDRLMSPMISLVLRLLQVLAGF